MDGEHQGIRQVLAPLRKLIKGLERKMKVEAVVVFGSRVRDDYLEDSDVDLLVISDDFEGLPRWERGYRILCEWKAPFTLEPVGMTTKELERCCGLLTWDALEEGIALYDTGVFARMKERFEMMKREGLLKLTEIGWRFEEEERSPEE